MNFGLETIKVIIADLTLLFHYRKPFSSQTSKPSIATPIAEPIVFHSIILRQCSLVILFEYLLHLCLKGELIDLVLQSLFERQGDSLDDSNTSLVLLNSALMDFLHAFRHIIDFPI